MVPLGGGRRRDGRTTRLILPLVGVLALAAVLALLYLSPVLPGRPQRRSAGASSEDSEGGASSSSDDLTPSPEVASLKKQLSAARAEARTLRKAKKAAERKVEELETEPEFRMVICVFTYNRIAGLKRLLHSLLQARYSGDKVDLTIFHDKLRDGHSDDGTYTFVADFKWPHGEFRIHRRQKNAGLKHSIMEAWYPSSREDRYAVFFEDDIEASPLWYLWARNAVLEYAGKDPKLLGISLYRPVHDELTGKSMVFDTSNAPYLLQQPCSWGAVYFPLAWKHFRDWYHAEGAQSDPITRGHGVPRLSSNTWAAKSSWKKYLIKYMWEKGIYMVYPNPPDRAVLSTNHLMKGEHPTPKRELFELPLLTVSAYEEAKEDGKDPLHAPPLESLRSYDVAVRYVGTYKDIPQYDADW